MGLTTPRYALRYPVAADANNVPTDMLNLATDLDNKMSSFLSGAFSARPAFGTSGRFYFATDTKQMFYDTGAAWRDLTGQPTIPIARYWLSVAPSSSATFAVIAWNNTTFNRNGMPTAAAKLTVPVTGYWKMRASARFALNAGTVGEAALQIRKGPNSDTAGTVMAYGQKSAQTTAGFGPNITVEVETRMQMNAGDDYAIWQAVSPGTPNTVFASSSETFVECELVSVT